MAARSLATALLLATLGSFPAVAGSSAEPRLVRVLLDGHTTAEALLRSGLDVVAVRRGSHALILEWPGDAEKLMALGAASRVLDESPGRSAASASRVERSRRPPAAGRRVWSAAREDGRYRLETLPAFGEGSLGGYWTLAEIKMELDALVANDVAGVVADKVDTIGASLGAPGHPSRPIWGLALGKAIPGPDPRPVVFLHGLTHAREPMGMQTVLRLAEDLVSRYGVDPEATYLLDHRRIYIVPVVNPGGFKFNEDQYVSSGGLYFGMHRKNLRDTNGDGVISASVDGVDLNRNYGYLWGLNDIGSSSDPTTGGYRGTAPFSEPETQAMRDAIVTLQPRVALDFHAFGDQLLYPWSYTTAATEDSAGFVEWSDEMTAGNGYQSGQGPQVLYETNGDFTDWAYGDVVLKPRVLAWTSEIGGPGDLFWPPPSRISPLAEENFRAAYYAAYVAGACVRVEECRVAESTLNAGSVAHIEIRARNQGAGGTAPGLTATLSSLTAGANVVEGAASLPTLGPLQSAAATEVARFRVSVDDSVTPGRLLRFRVDFSDPTGFFSRDTVDVLCGTPTLLVAEDAASTGNWTGRWVIENSDPTRPGPHFSDRTGTYKPNSDAAFTLNALLDLSHGVHAYASFVARWDFEPDYDCTVIEASLDGASWTPLKGTGTSWGRSGGEQPPGSPVYEGTRRIWRPERSDLSPFSGPASAPVRLRWRLLSDTGGQFDGFRFDSLRVMVFDPAVQPSPVAVGDARSPVLELEAPFPNPARGLVRTVFAVPNRTDVRLEVLDLQGRRIRSLAAGPRQAGRYAHGWDLCDEDGRPVGSGVYALRLSTSSGSATRRLVVLH